MIFIDGISIDIDLQADMILSRISTHEYFSTLTESRVLWHVQYLYLGLNNHVIIDET